MQESIDKEVDPAIEIEIQSHLKNCEKCSTLYSEVLEDKLMINRLLSPGETIRETDSIPEFKLPISKKKKNISFRLITVLVAASLIGLIFLFRFDRKPVTEKIPEAEMLMYEFYEGKDLNKLWHDKSQILIIQDEKGNVIQSTITY
jgi:hypothetical protein